MILLNTSTSEPLPLSWLIGSAVVAIIFIVGIRWIASRYQDKTSQKAKTYFEPLEGFEPCLVHAFGHTAIAYDDSSDHLAIWKKDEGAKLLNPNDVDSFFVGEVTKKTMSRYNAMATNALLADVGSKATINAYTSRVPYLILFDQNGRRAIFTVGFVSASDQPEWLDILTGVLGTGKKRTSVD